jgi:single-stranded-DNA-specific exonuclease
LETGPLDVPLRDAAKRISEELGITATSARVLVARGITTVEDARQFLNPNFRGALRDPSKIKNINTAASILLDFVENGELITVLSDFDVDGLTSAAQLISFLKALGAQVSHYTPNRFLEGYGVSPAAVKYLAKEGTKLLVTVDCGISNVKEVALAKSLGLKTVIIDHHIPHEIPDADAVVDPAQEGCPFQEEKMAAAGLVWTVLIVLRAEARKRGSLAAKAEKLPDPKDYLDLAALGTICDMVPLTRLNRVIAHRGMQAMRKGSRLGIKTLFEVSGFDNISRLNTGHISFSLGPRINAAGRLSDASSVVTLLTTTNEKQALRIARDLDTFNQDRREIEERVKEECLRFVAETPPDQLPAALLFYHENFHLGVLGIVAQRMVEQFNRPTTIMGPAEELINGRKTKVIKGSVRSVRGFHVADALQELAPFLVKFGGHAEAGGFSLFPEKLDEFREGFIQIAHRLFGPTGVKKRIVVDIELPLSDLEFSAVEELERFAPFGVGNPSPTFVARDVQVVSAQIVKDKHLRVTLREGDVFLSGVAWGAVGHPRLRKGEIIDLVYQPEINSYQGLSSVQITIKEAW